ncbi:hypothetical protein TNCV_1425631 [Trichonephila clavipes]|nr:hypothetical protein TNCV_1425631 [Trichonephila clavipes]
MPSEVPVDKWEGVDGLQFVGQAYPIHALLDSSPIHTGDILRMKPFVYNVCTMWPVISLLSEHAGQFWKQE